MVPKRLQEYDLTKRALGIRLVTKCVEYFFDGNDVFRLFIDCLPHYAICAFAEPFLNIESKRREVESEVSCKCSIIV